VISTESVVEVAEIPETEPFVISMEDLDKVVVDGNEFSLAQTDYEALSGVLSSYFKMSPDVTHLTPEGNVIWNLAEFRPNTMSDDTNYDPSIIVVYKQEYGSPTADYAVRLHFRTENCADSIIKVPSGEVGVSILSDIFPDFTSGTISGLVSSLKDYGWSQLEDGRLQVKYFGDDILWIIEVQSVDDGTNVTWYRCPNVDFYLQDVEEYNSYYDMEH